MKTYISLLLDLLTLNNSDNLYKSIGPRESACAYMGIGLNLSKLREILLQILLYGGVVGITFGAYFFHYIKDFIFRPGCIIIQPLKMK
jgi:hypothetical protein